MLGVEPQAFATTLTSPTTTNVWGAEDIAMLSTSDIRYAKVQMQRTGIVSTLIVEIFSPSTRLKDRNTKFNLYEQMGVKYYLMVDTDKKGIEYYQLVNNKYSQQENLLAFQFTETCKIEVSLSNIFTA